MDRLLSTIFEKIIGKFVKDDTKDMLEICNDVFCELAEKYKLTEEQAQKAMACEFIEPCLQEISKNT